MIANKVIKSLSSEIGINARLTFIGGRLCAGYVWSSRVLYVCEYTLNRYWFCI